jgi:hypothetical protein
MALPDVRNRIKDGAMGVLGADATGIFAAIGVASKPSGGGIITFSAPDQVEDLIGDGPLRDLLVSALSIAKTTVYAVALEGTVPGTCSEVTAGADNTGTGTVAAAGPPRNEYDVTVGILGDGGLNAGVFQVTIDGLPGKRITIPEDGSYPIPDTGITLAFTPGAGGFKEGDTFTFSTTAPAANNGEVLAAVDAILDAKRAIEWIALAGISAAPLWAALATKAEGAAEIFQYLFFVAQARYRAEAETLDQWVNALCGAERGTAASTRLQVIAGWIEEADANGQVDVRGLIGTYCGKLAGLPVHQGPDAVRSGSIAAATALKPDGINDGHIEALKNAGYVTARQIIGLNGIYVASGQIMSEAGSDYDLVERRRVMDKACRQVRTAQLIYLNDVVKVGADGSPEGLEMFVAQSENPLKIMVNAGEISSGQVVIPEGQNILSTKTLRTKVRIVPLGKLSYIENEIAYSNPALEVSNG